MLKFLIPAAIGFAVSYFDLTDSRSAVAETDKLTKSLMEAALYAAAAFVASSVSSTSKV